MTGLETTMVAETASAATKVGGGSQAIKNAEDLRTMLRQAELAIAAARGSGPEAMLELLHTFDAVEEAVPRLEREYGVDLKPERTRMETLENIVSSKAVRVVREAGAARLAAEREKVHAGPEEWWWSLDRVVAARRQAMFRRWATRGAVIAGLLLVLLLAYQFFLAPSPEQQALTAALSDGEAALLGGDLQAAQRDFDQALALSPNDPEVHLYAGAVAEQLGEEAKAREQFAEAQRLLDDPARYHASLALVYYRMASGGLDVLARAEEEALAGVRANDKSAIAHFALASVYELQGKMIEAIQEFEVTSTLSTEPQLTVLARMRMGMLMQSGGAAGTPTEASSQ